jgi:hypothetical protein
MPRLSSSSTDHLFDEENAHRVNVDLENEAKLIIRAMHRWRHSSVLNEFSLALPSLLRPKVSNAAIKVSLCPALLRQLFSRQNGQNGIQCFMSLRIIY